MRTMYDGVTPSRLPSGAPLYAGYVDGHYANIPAIRARFPHARIVGIAVSPHTNAGTVLDVEPGDASPAQAPAWVKMRRAAGVDPTVYCAATTWPAVRAAFKAAGVAEPHYWIAAWDGHATLPAGAVAKQYVSTSGYDKSVVADHWPGVDPAPAPAPATKPKVSLKNVIAAAKTDPRAAQGHTTHPADVRPVEAALRAEGLLDAKYAGDGSFGSLTVAAYAKWQRRCGYQGADADGIPGKTTLVKLGAKHGFDVTN